MVSAALLKSPENTPFYCVAHVRLEFVLKSELQLDTEDPLTKTLHVFQRHTDTGPANTPLCWRAALPYAFSQSRGDLSSSSNVNIAACVGELSNTLTRNLFRMTLTQSESVIMGISKMPHVPRPLLNFLKSSPIVMF